ncbi:MAG: response regulator [Zoogloea sp.]|nr:response regulator [Zoogloea sp.]
MKPMKVLVVDDQKVNRTLPRVLLQQAGCEVFEADCGEAALAFLTGQRVDAVLLDISMPGISGTDVCRLRRQDAACAGLCVVAYTAHALVSERHDILAAGFDELLIKPINRQRLLSVLKLPV